MEDLIISADTLRSAKCSADDLKIDFAVYMYDKNRLSIGQAKRIAGLSQIEFQKELSKRGISIKYSIEDIEQDLKNLDSLSK